jgi:hypothetical protein
MLALHEDEQETLYQHIRSVHPENSVLVWIHHHDRGSGLTAAGQTYEEMPLFTRSLAWVLY